jgi:mannosyltransferase
MSPAVKSRAHATHGPRPRAASPSASRRFTVIAAIGFSLIALAVSPTTIAWHLAGPGSARVPDVIQGVWILKAAVLAHAIALPLLARTMNALPSGAALVPFHSEPDEGGRATGLLLAGVLVLALVLRLVDLGAGLWHDEIATLVDFGRLAPREIVATYTAQNQHVLYSLLASITFGLFGESAWALRLPAALFGVASLGATYWFATLVTSRREALLATLLLAVSYHHVWFSQNGRGYTGLMMFAATSTGLFLLMLQGRSAKSWRTGVAYAIVMALAAYTHLTAAFMVVAHLAVWAGLAIVRRGTVGKRELWMPAIAILLAGTFTVLLYSLVVPQMAATLFAPKAEFADTPWRNPLWLVAETLRGASRGLPGGWVGLVAGLVVATAGTVSYLRRSAAATSLMILPVALTGIVLVGLGHNLWPRFFFFGAGFAVLVAVRGVFALMDRLPGRWAKLAPTGALLLASAASATTVPRAWAPKQDYAGALERVERDRAPDDGVAAVGLAAYAYGTWLKAPVTTVDDVAQLEALEREHRRVWLLYAFPTHLEALYPEIWAYLTRNYREVAEYPATVAGGTVYVMTRS